MDGWQWEGGDLFQRTELITRYWLNQNFKFGPDRGPTKVQWYADVYVDFALRGPDKATCRTTPTRSYGFLRVQSKVRNVLHLRKGHHDKKQCPAPPNHNQDRHHHHHQHHHHHFDREGHLLAGGCYNGQVPSWYLCALFVRSLFAVFCCLFFFIFCLFLCSFVISLLLVRCSMGATVVSVMDVFHEVCFHCFHWN